MEGKGLIKSIFSAFLCCCYLTAIVGFDTHVDHHDGEVFVVSLLEPSDCESLHPDKACHCFEHEHGNCHDDDEDCENISNFLSLTGMHSGLHFSLQPAFIPVPFLMTPVHDVMAESSSFDRPSVKSPPGEVLSQFCVLRV